MNINSSLSHRSQEPENSVLYIVGTPIGNLDDISLRALNILKNVSFIACEDTRQTKKLISKFGILNKLTSFHQHNSINKIPFIVDTLKKTKHKLKTQFGYLKTTETKLNGRFNADTIILKAFK